MFLPPVQTFLSHSVVLLLFISRSTLIRLGREKKIWKGYRTKESSNEMGRRLVRQFTVVGCIESKVPSCLSWIVSTSSKPTYTDCMQFIWATAKLGRENIVSLWYS